MHFPGNLAKFLRPPFFYEYLTVAAYDLSQKLCWWCFNQLLSEVSNARLKGSDADIWKSDK